MSVDSQAAALWSAGSINSYLLESLKIYSTGRQLKGRRIFCGAKRSRKIVVPAGAQTSLLLCRLRAEAA
jgi:hypothetical protein